MLELELDLELEFEQKNCLGYNTAGIQRPGTEPGSTGAAGLATPSTGRPGQAADPWRYQQDRGRDSAQGSTPTST